MLTPWKESYDQTRQHIKKQRHYFINKGLSSQIPLAVVLPRPARGAGTLIPSAQRLVWAAKQALGKAALGALANGMVAGALGTEPW